MTTRDVFYSPPMPNNPLEQAHRKLLNKLAAMKVPTIGSWPVAEDFLALKDYLREVADSADIWLRSVGNELNSNITHQMHADSFDGRFAEAIDGWATHECDRAAASVDEDELEATS